MSNNVDILAYSSGTTIVKNASLELAQNVVLSSVYPGGLYERMSFFMPFDTSKTWSVRPGFRIVARDSGNVVWEGWITKINRSNNATAQGFNVEAAGAWYYYLMSRKWNKPWADSRIDQNVWIYVNGISSSEKCSIDRRNRIRFTPKAEAWANPSNAVVSYTAPTGETVKRVTFNYDFQEAGQVWSTSLDKGSGAAEWSVSSSGTGSGNVTLSTPSQTIRFLYTSGAAQTPTSDGTYYAEFSSIVVYTETGSINLTEIAKDIRANVTELSANENKIASNTLSLVPFVSEGESMADALTRAASYGDSSSNSWACYIDASDYSSDGKPLLVVEQQPALTSTDYRLRLDENNVVGQINIEESIDEAANWISVEYQREEGGKIFVTPDDDSSLTDTTYITPELHAWLSLSTTSQSLAIDYGQRYLEKFKRPQIVINDGITLTGFVRTSAYGSKPVEEIRAGERIAIENIVAPSGENGLNMLITETEYNDASKTIRLSVGRPDSFATWLARIQRQIDQSGT